jgi:hypothetical protein
MYNDCQANWSHDNSEYSFSPYAKEIKASNEYKSAIDMFEFYGLHLETDMSNHILLDYGAGSGVKSLAACNFFKSVIMSDFIFERLEKLRSIAKEERLSSVLFNSAHKEEFSAILLWHVLEHLPLPFSTLQNLLKSPEILYLVQVPLLHERWINSSHVWFFNEYSLGKLFSNLNHSIKSVFYDVENGFMTVSNIPTRR